MGDAKSGVTASLFPALRYRDAPGAADWLERAFGFARHAVHEGPDGSVAHAELRYGNGMVMFGSARLTEPANPWTEGEGVYVAVDDIDAHYARAVAAGAEILRPLADTDYGAREYTARDPEGHLWSFGTYRP
ncbi:VOC family protein [Amaricoccus sp.]|uniref:VOC family protein n=1 Tax=Amaricoccus sp. TaxID=1872485 RepID=UPI001B3DDC06|nr:VOC family protein [Amaricoccus sp.]MBP7000086.1 VOC family protein [Amaricoccus sp.]